MRDLEVAKYTSDLYRYFPMTSQGHKEQRLGKEGTLAVIRTYTILFGRVSSGDLTT
jgi:hypothetical protein